MWSSVEKHVYGNLLGASARLRMPAYEVLAVSVPAATPAKLLGAGIDLPKTGLTATVLTLHVAGWAVGRESPADAVEILYQPAPGTARPGPGRVIRVTPIRGPRGDVAGAFPEVDPEVDCHFESLVGVNGMTPEFELRLMVALADGSRAEIGSVRVRREPLRTGYGPRLAPIVLSGLGRSGSTPPDGAAGRPTPRSCPFGEFPYESRPTCYGMQALKVLAEPSNIVQLRASGHVPERSLVDGTQTRSTTSGSRTLLATTSGSCGLPSRVWQRSSSAAWTTAKVSSRRPRASPARAGSPRSTCGRTTYRF